mgnify:CR=1 FL=1
MKKIKTILIILAIILLAILLWWFFTADKKTGYINETKILGNTEDLVSFSVEPGQEVSGEIIATGSIKGGYFFEGNILVNILDDNKKLLRAGNGNAKTDWMTSEPVGFDAILDFTKLKKGNAYIEIHNDNASGLPEKDKSILIPIIIN